MPFRDENDAPLREGQIKILEYFRRVKEERMISPSLREAARDLGYKSPTTIHNHLVSLRRKGRVRWSDKACRCVEIIGEAEETDPAMRYRLALVVMRRSVDKLQELILRGVIGSRSPVGDEVVNLAEELAGLEAEGLIPTRGADQNIRRLL